MSKKVNVYFVETAPLGFEPMTLGRFDLKFIRRLYIPCFSPYLLFVSVGLAVTSALHYRKVVGSNPHPTEIIMVADYEREEIPRNETRKGGKWRLEEKTKSSSPSFAVYRTSLVSPLSNICWSISNTCPVKGWDLLPGIP